MRNLPWVNASQILSKSKAKAIQIKHFKFAHAMITVCQRLGEFNAVRGVFCVKQIDVFDEQLGPSGI